MSQLEARQISWIHYGACAWAIVFAAPHVWWALGISAGFPGGEANHRLMMDTPWRLVYDVVVILLTATAFIVALVPIRPWGSRIPRWIHRTAAWIACGMLSLRGVAGMVVDGLSELIWWPLFLAGGILFGMIAWAARTAVRPSATDK